MPTYQPILQKYENRKKINAQGKDISIKCNKKATHALIGLHVDTHIDIFLYMYLQLYLKAT